VFSIRAPVFFGIVGLKVDLWNLGGGKMVLIVLGVACIGKLVGCALGALWGGLRFWESLSIAIAMNARGAMELVVASIGLSLGILNQPMYSMIVVVAIVTSFMAPLGLRLTVPRVRMTEDEERRIFESESKLAFHQRTLRVLLPTAGGEPALEASRIAYAMMKQSENAVHVLHIDADRGLRDRVRRFFRGDRDKSIDSHLDAIKKLANGTTAPVVRRISSNTVSSTIVEEAKKGFDLLVLGAKDLGSNILEDVVERAPCHVLIVRAHTARSGEFKNVFVPIEGGSVSRVAVELAVRYAEATGAKLTVALLEQRTRFYSLTDGRSNPDELEIESPKESDPLARVSDVFRLSHIKPEVLQLGFDPTGRATERAVSSGNYDLVVLGAENRAIQHRLFFGHEAQRLLRKNEMPIAIVVPNIAKLG
jgi:nucleotide-binding universal stress UspA family protein